MIDITNIKHFKSTTNSKQKVDRQQTDRLRKLDRQQTEYN